VDRRAVLRANRTESVRWASELQRGHLVRFRPPFILPNGWRLSSLAEHPETFADEWKQLCEWFKSNATEALSRSKSEHGRDLILCTVAAFCRDVPPQTAEGLAAFRSFAERQVDLWQTAPFPDSEGDLPIVSKGT
jgi:hypothetical protein